MKRVGFLIVATLFALLLIAPLFSVGATEIGQNYFLTFSASQEMYRGDEKLTETERNQLVSRLSTIIKNYENKVSASVGGSDVLALNQAENGTEIAVSSETVGLFARAEELRLLTGGAFDYRLGSLVSLWGFWPGDAYSTPRKSPSDTEIATRLTEMRASSLALDGQTLVKTGNATYDFGAVAKGHLTDLLHQELVAEGITDGNLTLMSNHLLLGKKIEGENSRNWRVGIKDPRNPTVECLTFEAKDAHVATSGDYERCYVYDEKRYSHILDAKTGAPAQTGVMSVTVVGNNGALCDAVATASFSLGAKGALLLAKDVGVEIVVICVDYKYYVSDGLVVKPSSEVYAGYPSCRYEKGDSANAPEIADACESERKLYRTKSHITEWIVGGVAIAMAVALVIVLAVNKK